MTLSRLNHQIYQKKEKLKTLQTQIYLLTEGVKPSKGFFPAFESAKSSLAVLMYDFKPPG